MCGIRLRDVAILAAQVEPADDTEEMLAQIRAIEQAKAALAAAQARVTAAYAQRRRAEQREEGVRASRIGAGVAHEVALAKRESPNKGQRYVGFAAILTRELPATFAALQAGETTEWRAMLVARETAWLSLEHRLEADSTLGPRLHAMGDREVEAETKREAYRLDPRGCVERMRRAEEDRRVTLRPAPDAMSRLSALLPVAQGVAVLKALGIAADSARARGDGRSRGQVMADALVQRCTGQAAADGVPVVVNVTLPAETLLGTGDGPADVEEYGPVPGPVARGLVTRCTEDTPAWIRRLLTDPAGRIVAMETTSRLFTPAMREFIGLRDRTCRTPYCGAPIRHADHVQPWIAGGPTSLANAQGLCEACSYAKEATRAGPFGAEAAEAADPRDALDPPDVADGLAADPRGLPALVASG